MKIMLLDPGLATIKGHHFDIDLRLYRALQQRGHDVVMHTYLRPEQDLQDAANAAGIPLHKTFRVTPYAQLPTNRPEHESYRMLEDATAEDLKNVDRDGLWLWPTLAPYQLAAGLKAGAGLRQIGGIWWTPQVPVAAGATSWARSTKQLAEVPGHFLVGAYDELLCQRCITFSSGLPILRLPCPHDGAPNARQSQELKTIGFFGHQRRSRGLDILKELVEALLGKGYDVVIQDSGAKIKASSRDGRLRILNFVDDFAAEIAKCDAIVWPSRWESYTDYLSGVVGESIATGVPVIAPSGCIPAELLARYEAGTFFHEFSTEAILSAVDAAAESFPRLRDAARRAAKEWHAHNGTTRLVQWIESHDGLSRGAGRALPQDCDGH